MNYPLFETLCIENGQVQNLALHQQRYEQSLRAFYPQYQVQDLQKLFAENTALWAEISTSIIRCRIDYNATECHVQCFPYQRKAYRTFQPVFCDEIDYSLKYADRTLLNQLLQQRGDCDEIMIIKNGKVTDCSIGNLIFRQSSQWFTPDSPLLAGTQRRKLLSEGKIKVRSIFFEDLPQYEEVRLINALNPLE